MAHCRPFVLVSLWGLLSLSLAAGCARPGGTPSGSTPEQPAYLVVSGDTAGWIVPCGCTTNQAGGLLRRGCFVKQLSAKGDVLVLDVGGAPGGSSTYQRLKFDAILQGEKGMGLNAHNLGAAEAALGADEIRQLSRRLEVPFVSANVRAAQGELLAAPIRVLSWPGGTLGITGVLSPRLAPPGVRVDPPRDAILAALRGLPERPTELVVLAYLPEEELQGLAASLPEADLVLGGPTGQSIAPRRVGPVLLAAATNKGKYVLELTASTGGKRSDWSGRIVELTADFPDDPEQQQNLRRYLDELARRDLPASETGFAPPLPSTVPAGYHVAGNTACQTCHTADCTSWQKSRHAQAWDVLTERGLQVDAFCQQCHSNAFGLPGGFVSAQRSAEQRGVGCETCHGPSQAHARNPRTRTSFAARDQCSRCHDAENSPRFEISSYWERMRHGVAINPKSP